MDGAGDDRIYLSKAHGAEEGIERMDWQIIALPFSSEPGHDMWRGPSAILKALDLKPAVWVPVPIDEPTIEGWQALAKEFRQVVTPQLKADRPWLFVTGECTAAPLPVGALQHVYGPVQVVWIDAHGDIHTPESSTSHFLGGMPLNLLIGGSLGEVRQAAGTDPIPLDHVTMVGTRDLDPAEAGLIRQSGIVPLYDPEAIRTRVAAIGLPAYLHVDIDVLDPTVNPAASYPSPGGMTLEALVGILEQLATTGLIKAATVAAFSPGLDRDNLGLVAATRVMHQLLG